MMGVLSADCMWRPGTFVVRVGFNLQAPNDKRSTKHIADEAEPSTVGSYTQIPSEPMPSGTRVSRQDGAPIQ